MLSYWALRKKNQFVFYNHETGKPFVDLKAGFALACRNSERRDRRFDILLSLKGEDSYGAGCWSGLFGGFLPQPPYFSGGQRRGLTFGLSTQREEDVNRTDLRPQPQPTCNIPSANLRERWCPREDSNLHDLAITSS